MKVGGTKTAVPNQTADWIGGVAETRAEAPAWANTFEFKVELTAEYKNVLVYNPNLAHPKRYVGRSRAQFTFTILDIRKTK